MSVGVRLGALFGPAVFGVTAAGIALPDVGRALGATPSATAWVLTAHALALGVGTALAGRLADVRGVRRVLLVGVLLLAAGTAVCLAAPGIGVLVAGRFLLAAGSGALSAGALALAAASAPERRGPVLAVFGATMAVFSAGATLAGGAVTEWLSWRLTLVLPVLSVLALPFVLPLVPPLLPRTGVATAAAGRRSVDGFGAALLTVTAGSLLVLVQSSALSLSAGATAVVAALLVVAGLLLGRRVLARPDGFVPRATVADPLFVRAAITGAGVYAGLFGAMYAVPRLLVDEFGWSVLAIGGWLLPGAVLGAVLSRRAGAGLARGNVRGGTALLTAASLTGAVLLALTGLTGLTGLVDGGPAVAVAGASFGFAAMSVTQVVATGVLSARLEPRRRGGALALLNLTFFVGGGIGSAVAGALATSLTADRIVLALAVFPLIGAAGATALGRAAGLGGAARG
ncbi:MFS transporter [Streptomyces sp. NPDC047315]|uniref:MFS transporter n=1 Tax=Streptomyces sp. NPDC047315 TaxID=3155142 RepID=UPI003407CE71